MKTLIGKFGKKRRKNLNKKLRKFKINGGKISMKNLG